MDICKITVIGHVQPRDPESRFTPDGRPVTQFRMVSNRRRKGRDNEQIDEGEWFQVTAFGRLAEICAEHLAKGSKVYVEGRFSSRVWKDNESKERTSMEITANDVILLGGRVDGTPVSAGAGQYQGAPGAVDELADLPF